jgi:hypothetical protein
MEVIGRSLAFVGRAVRLLYYFKHKIFCHGDDCQGASRRAAQWQPRQHRSDVGYEFTTWPGGLGGNPLSLEFTFGTNYLAKASRKPVSFQQAQRPQEI